MLITYTYLDSRNLLQSKSAKIVLNLHITFLPKNACFRQVQYMRLYALLANPFSIGQPIGTRTFRIGANKHTIKVFKMIINQ